MSCLLISTFFTLQGQNFNFHQKIIANDRMTKTRLGHDVAISGDFAIVSAYEVQKYQIKNAVYIYQKDPTGIWIQIQKLESPENVNWENFGYSIDIKDDQIIIGDFRNELYTRGVAYIYDKIANNVWQLSQRLLETPTSEFGYSVSIDGDHCAVTALGENSSQGAVYIYEKNGSGIWTRTAKLIGSHAGPNDVFGYKIKIRGTLLFAGAPGDDDDVMGTNFMQISGAVYIYQKDSNNIWQEVQKIVDPQRMNFGEFGATLSVYNNLLIIGAGSANNQWTNFYRQNCYTFIYIRDATGVWNFNQRLDPPDPIDDMGYSNNVAINDNYAIVSSIDEKTDAGGNFIGNFTGAVYSYKRQPDNSWSLVQRIVAPNPLIDDYFGRCVALQDEELLIGAWWEDEDENEQNTIQEAGSVYVYNMCAATTSSEVLVSCDSLQWIDGNVYKNSISNIQYVLDNAAGCDSIISLDLTINNSDLITQNEIFCDVYNWQGNTYKEGGTYYYQSTNQYGCDSTITLNLTIHNSTNNIEQKSACDSIIWNGTTYDNSGIHTYTTTNIYNCDSTETLNLTIYPSSQKNINFTTCEAYTWNGQTYAQSGIYTYLSTNIYGCDSITTLNLIIHPTITETIQETQCDAYTWNGTTYTQSGSYDYQTLSVLNCDSIATLELTIHPSSQAAISYSSCDPYLWNGNIYTESGTYSYKTQNMFGCDSTTTLDLTVHPNNNNTTTQTACDTYTWSGTTYDQSGSYSTTATNIFGCDSISTLNLTIHPSQNIFTTETACSSFIWQGTAYNQSGVYTYQTQTAFGCDSTITLNLTIHPESNTDITTTACDSLVYQGQTITESGIYNFSLQNINGCDSTINLNLTISADRNENTLSACGTYLWPVTGEAYTQSGTYQAVYTNAQGCDSTYRLDLTIHPEYNQETTAEACAKYLWTLNNQTYTQSGQHSVTLRTQEGCDSIITLDVTIHPEFEYRDTIITNEPYLWPINNTSYETSGIYTETFATDVSCDSIHYLYLTISIDTDIHVPNIISPDGPNSQFTFYGSSISIIQDLSVYDRWGNQVFHRNSFPPNEPTQGWDGKYQGKNLTPGVYTYSAQLLLTDGTIISKYGDVTIIR